jgi:putative transposase
MYHFIWIPEYRLKVFCEPYRETLKGTIEKIGFDYDIEIVELEIPEIVYSSGGQRQAE